MTPQVLTQTDWLKMAELCIDMAAAWPEMCRLAAITPGPDGYGRGNQGVRGSGVSNPTAATVITMAGGKDRLDGDIETTPDTWRDADERVGTLVAHLLEQSRQMDGYARRVSSLKHLIENRGDSRVGRQSSLQGDCLACEKPVSGVGTDRIRSGYCPACHRAWLRFRLTEMVAGREPVHETFRRRRAREARAS